MKGFTLNFTNAQNINFQTMKEMLLSSDPLEKSFIITNPCKITRNKNHNLINNRKEKKRYRIVYTKRCVDWSTFRLIHMDTNYIISSDMCSISQHACNVNIHFVNNVNTFFNNCTIFIATCAMFYIIQNATLFITLSI